MDWFLYGNGPRHEKVKDCFNKYGYNFGNVNKNGYAIPSENKAILEERVWRHNFSP